MLSNIARITENTNAFVRAGLFLALLSVMLCGIKQAYATQGVSSQTMAAIKQAQAGRWQEALRTAQKADEDTQTLIEWMYVTQAPKVDRSFEAIDSLIKRTEGWPYRTRLLVEAEKRFPKNWSADDVLAWFNNRTPTEVEAAIIYGKALFKRDPKKAKDFIRTYWANNSLTPAQQDRFFKTFGDHLSQADHVERINSLIWAGRYQDAEKLYPKVPLDIRLVSKARIKLLTDAPDVQQAIGDVPRKFQNDEGLLYARLLWRRKKDLNDGMEEILVGKTSLGSVTQGSAWWRERHILVRRYLEKKQYERAYRVASTHQQTEGFSFAEGEWTSGWIALSFLNKPVLAFDHFFKMYNKVQMPISKSRAAYWAGQASLAMGDKKVAKHWLARAAQYSTTFYGQLANTRLRSLDPNYPVQLLPLVDRPDPETRKAFRSTAIVKAIRAFDALDMIDMRSLFFSSLIKNTNVPSYYALAAEMAEDMKAYDAVILASKEALEKGYQMIDAGYPTLDGIKHFNGIEQALAYAIIRQESAFKVNAKSSAGAMGLMQLMPGTARETAGKLGLPYQQTKLSTSPSYNIQLGTRYMADLLKYYDGYYVLAIAAYNAGPGRVNRLLKEIGDPRDGQMNIVDWIELIPIYETRNYVQRVLEGLHVYRMQLNSPLARPDTDSLSHIRHKERYE